MEIKKLNEDYLVRFPRLVEILIIIGKETRKLYDNKNIIDKFFYNREAKNTTVEEITEQFQMIVDYPVDFFNKINTLTDELSDNYSFAFSKYKMFSEYDMLKAIMSTPTVKLALADALVIDTDTTNEDIIFRISNKLYLLAVNKLLELGQSVLDSIKQEIGLVNNSALNDISGIVSKLYKESDNYDLDQLIKDHNTNSKVAILMDSINANANLKSVFRANIINFISNSIGKADAYNALDGANIVTEKEIALDLIKRIGYILLSLKSECKFKLYLSDVNSKRGEECLINIQKEAANIRFTPVEILTESDFDYTIAIENTILEVDGKLLVINISKKPLENLKESDKYTQDITLVIDENTKYSLSDINAVGSILNNEEVLLFLGKVSIALFTELNMIKIGKYNELYLNKISENVDNTRKNFILSIESIITNNINLNILSDILIRNKALDLMINNSNNDYIVFGSTSSEDERKEIIKMVTMIAVFIGDLKYGNAE